MIQSLCIDRLVTIVSCSKDVFDMNCLCLDAVKPVLDRDLEYCTWRSCGRPNIEWMTKLCGQCDKMRSEEQANRAKLIRLEGGKP